MSSIFAATTALLIFAAPPATNAPTATDATADAQARKGTTKTASGKVVSQYDFENDYVDGKTLSPDGENIASRGNPNFESMISIRRTFMDKLEKLAHDI